MAAQRAPKQWSLTKQETITSFEALRQNLQYTLSLDQNFAPFLVDRFTWNKKTAADPLRGLMLWLFVGPTGVYLLDFFCSGIQFNLLLSPYPCFISLLYLDLYVLGDDALIS